MFKRTALLTFCFFSMVLPASLASGQTYTSARYLYAVDYPDNWHVKEAGKATSFLSPFESPEDVFAENVTVVVEDLSDVPLSMSLLDYHRRAASEAPKRLRDFKLLEEAKTEFIGREAIAILYTATVKGQSFKFKDYKFMLGKEVYVVTYTALREDFEKYLPMAEKIMGALRVSP